MTDAKACTGCLVELPLDAFYKQGERKTARCKSCTLRQQYVARSGLPPDTYVPLADRPRKQRDQVKLRAYMADYNRQYRLDNKDHLASLKRKLADTAKSDGIAAYGGVCVCCGECDPRFLTVDHINGRTDEPYRVSGKRLWLQLRRQGWPKDNYQLLCFNCNCAKGAYGRCPHLEDC